MPGKLHITVSQARNLPKCDPYCIVAWSSDPSKEIARTNYIDQESNPSWDSLFTVELPAEHEKQSVVVTVMDKESIRKDILVGSVSIPLASLRDREERDQWYTFSLNNPKDAKTKESPAVRVIFIIDTKDVAPLIYGDNSKATKEEVMARIEEAKKQLTESRAVNDELIQEINGLFGDVYYEYCHPKILGRVELTVVSGRDLPIKDILGGTIDTLLKGTSDPYCVITCGGQVAKTTVKKNNLNPDWDESFMLPVMHHSEELVIDIFDEDMIGSDEFMGQVVIPIGNLIDKGIPTTKQTYPLRPKKFQSESSAKEVKGTLSVLINYSPASESQAEVERVSLKRKSDLLEMATRVRQNLLERLAISNAEAEKAKELVEDFEAIFKSEFFSMYNPAKIGKLTTKVLQAQDLLKKDVIGSSDPFVVVELDEQKFQTNVIKNNLNPTWDNQNNDIFSLGSTLHVSAFDHDDVGKPDFMGKIYLQLADIFNACKEYGSVRSWYLLGPQKGSTISVKDKLPGQILLEFSCDAVLAEKSKTSNKDEVTKVLSAVEALLVDTIKRKDQDLDSEFMFQQSIAELFTKEYNEMCATDSALYVQVFGPATLRAAESVKIAIQKQIETCICALQRCSDDIYLVTQAVAQLIFTTLSLNTYTNLCKPNPIATVDVTVVEARNLAKKDVIGSSDPFCVVQIERVEKQTEVKHNTLNPKWDKQFQYTITRPKGVFEISLWDYDRIGASDHLGSLYIDLEQLIGGCVDKWFPLGPRRGKHKPDGDIQGDVHLVFNYHQLPVADIDKGADAISMIKEIHTATQEKLTYLADQLKQEHEFVTEVNSMFMKDYYTYCEPQKIAHLTVQVVEARGLAIKDLIGTSDPYVVVKVEDQEQKTETIFNNLNPVWNAQTFSFGLTRLNSIIACTLYDYDKTGSDDFLGYVEIPVTAKENLNVIQGTETGRKKLDVWLPVQKLKTEPDDNITGDLRLIVEFTPIVSTEQPTTTPTPSEVIKMAEEVRTSYHTQIATATEEAKSSREFISVVDALFTPEYYEWCKPEAIAELTVQVVEANDLVKADLLGKSDPYVVLQIENQKGATRHVNNTLNPKWDEVIKLPITKLTGSLLVHVFDHDLVGSDESLGSASVNLTDVLLQTLEGQKPYLTYFVIPIALTTSRYEVTLPLAWLNKSVNKPISGKVSIVITYLPIKAIKQENKTYQKEVEERSVAVKNELLKRANETGSMLGKLLQRIETERPRATSPISDGILTLSILGARGLLAADILTNTSDPYCIVKMGSFNQKTQVVKKTLEPQWNASFTIPVVNYKTAILEVTVMDHDFVGSDDFLGTITMPVSLFENGSPYSGWFQLQSYKKYKAKGEINMEVTYSTKPPDADNLIDFGVEIGGPLGALDYATVSQALDEVLVAYEQKVKALQKELHGVKAEKEQAQEKSQSLASKLSAFAFGSTC